MEPPEQRRKLIVLRPREGKAGYVVTQRDLEEERYLERQAKDAIALWRIKREAIQRYLELGCEVEPGLREAHLDLRVRDANGEHPQSWTKLVVK